MSHTTPITHIDSIAPYRCYVVFYYNKKRQRIYNGKPINESCNPNGQKSMKTRKADLARLCQLVTQALANGWYPGKQEEVTVAVYVPTAVEEIQAAQSRFDKNGWAITYKRDMNRLTTEFISYLNSNHPLAVLADLKPVHLARFLDNYRSSGRYYMNKRRNLSALYKLLDIDTNPVKATPTMKVTELLNEAYTPEQLTVVLQYLKDNSPLVYLCALLTYGTLLRPHREIRLLKRANFDAGMDFILLAGKSTKNGKVRRVPVPEYCKLVLLGMGVDKLEDNQYIFSGTEKPLNPDYFTTAWSRVKNQMLLKGIITKEQTLYSFRHSAAIYVFSKTQNLKLLQGLMDHGSPDVSLKYLRSVGVMEASSAEDLPKLPEL